MKVHYRFSHRMTYSTNLGKCSFELTGVNLVGKTGNVQVIAWVDLARVTTSS
jgi:hypothetical protein